MTLSVDHFNSRKEFFFFFFLTGQENDPLNFRMFSLSSHPFSSLPFCERGDIPPDLDTCFRDTKWVLIFEFPEVDVRFRGLQDGRSRVHPVNGKLRRFFP